MLSSSLLHRFLSKFLYDILPAALASVVGAMFFAQQWARPPQNPPLPDRAAAQTEQVMQMIRDEHVLMMEFLKKQQQLEAARQPMPLKQARALEAAAAAPVAAGSSRQPSEISRETNHPLVAVPAPRARPEVAPTIVESGPLAAPTPNKGVIPEILDATAAWKEKAIELSGVREIPTIIRELPAWVDSATGSVGMTSTSSAERLLSASR